MIFVTVGEQLPFDRLIRTVDMWAGESGQSVFAQIGTTKLIPKNIKYKDFLDATEFKEMYNNAELIISHAGMGSIITALEMAKPIIVMPRKAEFGEHRNDHQLATAKRFMALKNLPVAFNESELIEKLKNLDELKNRYSKDFGPSPYLIREIRNFILD